jgi:hypothetical protein
MRTGAAANRYLHRRNRACTCGEPDPEPACKHLCSRAVLQTALSLSVRVSALTARGQVLRCL